jgi:hypothetical protein
VSAAGENERWRAISAVVDVLIDRLAEALVDVWDQLQLPRQPQILAAE